MEPIKVTHFSHKHPMVFSESFKYEALCYACQSSCLGSPTYYCENYLEFLPPYDIYNCRYFLHKRCFECPQRKVTHTSHPPHPITLIVLDHEKIRCNSCRRETCLFVFNCSQCNWNLCIDCHLLPKHVHNYYFHSHDDHPSLTLLMNPYSQAFTCSLCHINFESDTPRFSCSKCRFVIDVECALRPPIEHYKVRENVRHFTHPHPMTLVNRKDHDGGDDDDDDNCCCVACGFPCKPGLAYFACIDCKYFLHKSCAELPRKIMFCPLDDDKHLHCVIQWPEKYHCILCYNIISGGFCFERSHELSERSATSFYICGRCIFSRPRFRYEGHRHLLCLVDEVHERLECSAGYDNYCKLPATSYELRSTELSVYRCIECDFNVHLLCGPLPCTIECYECHIHPLVLVDSLVEDDSGEYYCDICEDKRDPRICVYCCAKCQYIAHVHCVISKVMSILRGDLKNVRLKTVKIHEGEHEKLNKVFKGKEVLEQLTTNEQVTLLCDFDRDVWDIFEPPEDVRKAVQIRKLSRFSTNYFGKFVDRLLNMEFDSSKESKLIVQSLLSSSPYFVSVEGYLIPRHLARILVNLFRRHGDISNNSESTPGMKSFIFSFLCQVLHDIASTEVGRITVDRLKNWYVYANYAKRRGFDVEFLFHHLKHVVRAFIGLQATAERYGWDIELLEADYIVRLQTELDSFNSRSSYTSSFVDRGEFLMECLSVALISLRKKNFDDPLLI